MNIHEKRQHIHLSRTLGDKVADAVVGVMGSWRFIIMQSIIVGAWLTLNSVAFAFHWDPAPFILLNLLFSTQAAYASPLILMASNRQAAKDQMRDDLEAKEVDESAQRLLAQETRILAIAEHLDKQDELILQVVKRLDSAQQKSTKR